MSHFTPGSPPVALRAPFSDPGATPLPSFSFSIYNSHFPNTFYPKSVSRKIGAGADFLQFEGRLLANQLALVPRVVMMNPCRFHRDLHSVEGDPTVRRPPGRTFILIKLTELHDRY